MTKSEAHSIAFRIRSNFECAMNVLVSTIFQYHFLLHASAHKNQKKRRKKKLKAHTERMQDDPNNKHRQKKPCSRISIVLPFYFSIHLHNCYELLIEILFGSVFSFILMMSDRDPLAQTFRNGVHERNKAKNQIPYCQWPKCIEHTFPIFGQRFNMIFWMRVHKLKLHTFGRLSVWMSWDGLIIFSRIYLRNLDF